MPTLLATAAKRPVDEALDLLEPAGVEPRPEVGDEGPVRVVDGAAAAEERVVPPDLDESLVRDPAPGGHPPEEREHLVGALRPAEGDEEDRVVGREGVGACFHGIHATGGRPTGVVPLVEAGAVASSMPSGRG